MMNLALRKNYLLFLIPAIIFTIVSCGGQSGNEAIDEEALAMKAEIDSAIARQTYYSEVLIKKPGQIGLEVVKNQEFPPEIEKVYTIWRNAENQIRLIATTPLHHQSGLNLVFEHYFRPDQTTFAFSKNMEFFNTACSNYPLIETETFFYNENFEKNGYLYFIRDEAGNFLDTSICETNHKAVVEYQVSPNLEAYLNLINTGK